MAGTINNGLPPNSIAPVDIREESSDELIAGLPSFFSKLGDAVSAGATAYYNSRATIDIAKSAATHRGSGYNYGNSFLGVQSGDLPPSALAQEEYAADAAVNALARQSQRIGTQLFKKYGIYVLAAAGVWVALR